MDLNRGRTTVLEFLAFVTPHNVHHAEARQVFGKLANGPSHPASSHHNPGSMTLQFTP